ncbi:phage antirepressor KilAC domain-containing protein [Comamonas testosteroni]|uniref:phage antirepressor KilAC domain-containing protein n=1 Tax=Comamonas testosteroni TaxID=285 RepID=UPI0005B48911|nr:phage antirepressor KilAC domain-containing protein [Comamonas testosteroni]
MNLNPTLSPVAVPLTMSSREIADLVEARHNDVVATVLRLFSKGLLRSSRKTRREVTGGRPIDVYDLIERDTHLVVSGYSDEHRARVIDRWQALEARQSPALPNFADPVAAARAWADAKEGEQIAVAQLAQAAPKVHFFDKVVERTTLMTATQIAQKLGMSAIKLNKYLDELGIYAMGVKRARVFKQWVIDKGYGELKQTELGYSQPLFTTAGEAWIVERLTSEGVA